MQSKFFNAALNSAIFDGPVRIYFAQFHEAQALKIYFLIQQKLTVEMQKAKELSKASGANVFILIYHTVDSFERVFEKTPNESDFVRVESWHRDVVLGLSGPLEDEQLDHFIETLRLAIANWRPALQETSAALAEL